MSYRHIQFEVIDKIATLTLNRLEARNALDTAMRNEVADVVARLREGEDGKDLDVRALVIRGAGGAFSAGGDVKAMTKIRSAAVIRHRLIDAQRWHANLWNLEMPVIAAVGGPAFGAGFSLALTADFLLASPQASFCSVFARMGLIPDLGCIHALPRMVGLQKAKDIMFSARVIGAEEGKLLGFVYDVVAHEQLDAAALALARRFTDASMTAIGLTKVLLNKSFETDQRTMAELEAAAQGAAANTPEHREAVEAFLARKPLAYPGFGPADWKGTGT